MTGEDLPGRLRESDIREKTNTFLLCLEGMEKKGT